MTAAGNRTPSSERQHRWPNLLTQLVQGENLPAAEAQWAMQEILQGNASPVQVAGFAVALRAKGETVEELGALAEAMMDEATSVSLGPDAVDVVGTGGDRLNTVNISTMAALTAAASGAKVVKHGNRAASSACGTADCLEALGVVLALPPEVQQQVMDEVGIVFLFAPHYHSSLKYAASTRRELAIATTFNFLGPLANPARPLAGAIGVADARMAPLMAGVLAARGSRGLVFHGGDGLDELSTTTDSQVWVINHGRVRETVLDPRELGIERATIPDLVGGPPPHNADVARRVFAGETGPIADIVRLNAAAAVLSFEGPDPDAELGPQLQQRLERVTTALNDSSATETLQRWIDLTQSLAR